MTPQEFAALLNGREYREEISEAEEQLAKEHGLVVCFGYSDDNLELRGAIREEISAWNGVTALVANGSAFDGDELPELEETLQKIGMSLPSFRAIKAEWGPKDIDASWLITTEGGAPFDILKDGEVFCRGCVFKLETGQ